MLQFTGLNFFMYDSYLNCAQFIKCVNVFFELGHRIRKNKHKYGL